MNANLTFPSINTVSPNGANLALSTTQTDGDPKTDEFAAVLTGQMFKSDRQGLAAQLVGSPSLQVFSLGQKLNVITTDEPLPDLTSLANFARAQGLDEAAIQALFGPSTGSKSQLITSGAGQALASKTLPGVTFASVLPNFGKANLLAFGTDAIGQERAALAQGATAVVPELRELGSFQRIEALRQGQEALAETGVAVSLPASITTTGHLQAGAGAGSAVQDASRPQEVNIPLAASVGIAALAFTEPSSPTKVSGARPEVPLPPGSEESIQDAMRIAVTVSAKDIIKRPPNSATTTDANNGSGLLVGLSSHKVAVTQAWETLHLAIPEGFDLDEQSGTLSTLNQAQITAPGIPQHPEGYAARLGPAEANPFRGEPSAVAAQTELRALQQQQLADRLGEAAAHRLIAQIERGEWKMQMRLQPGKLGKIDVELAMHARGLEATFSADSALTRELIAQGTNRLKDTLAQAGMTVASVTVNGDQARQSGGNPTPQRGNQNEVEAVTVNARAAVLTAAPETPPTNTDDRLNILA